MCRLVLTERRWARSSPFMNLFLLIGCSLSVHPSWLSQPPILMSVDSLLLLFAKGFLQSKMAASVFITETLKAHELNQCCLHIKHCYGEQQNICLHYQLKKKQKKTDGCLTWNLTHIQMHTDKTRALREPVELSGDSAEEFCHHAFVFTLWMHEYLTCAAVIILGKAMACGTCTLWHSWLLCSYCCCHTMKWVWM